MLITEPRPESALAGELAIALFPPPIFIAATLRGNASVDESAWQDCGVRRLV
jgi:hypothetical protein